MIRPIPNDGSMTLGVISSTCSVFVEVLTVTISRVSVTFELPTVNECSPALVNAVANADKSSRLSAAKRSVMALASFLNTLPSAGLFGMASVISTDFGVGKRFSADNLTPVAVVCCVRS